MKPATEMLSWIIHAKFVSQQTGNQLCKIYSMSAMININFAKFTVNQLCESYNTSAVENSYHVSCTKIMTDFDTI